MEKVSIKSLVLKNCMLHEIGVNQLKDLVLIYGYNIVNKMVKFIYRYQYLRKCFYVKQDIYSTRFYTDKKLTSFKIVRS